MNTQNPPRALERRTSQLNTLKAELTRTSGMWAKSVPQTMNKLLTPDRVTKVVLLAASKKGSQILQCTVPSIIRSVADAVSLGLEPGGPLGHGYLVAFKNKGVLECQFIIGYRGFIALARRSGEISSVEAHAYYENDKARITLGSESKIEHEPCMEGPRGALKGVYCIAHFVGGGSHMDFMSKSDVDRIRSLAPGKDSPAWKNHYDEMARKTVVRRSAKYWPLSVEMAEALARPDDDDPDQGVIDISFEEEETPTDEEEGAPDEQQLPEHVAENEDTAPKEQQKKQENEGVGSVAHYQKKVQDILDKK